jgi:uroporphyrinogen decarboxylase
MTADPLASRHLLVRAALGEAVERPPVWAMRQAGRWDPEFNRIRAGLPFYEFSERVEQAAQVTLCSRRFGVDGIILFYDITTLAVAMGQQFTLQPARGPVPDRPVRGLADVDRLQELPDPARFQHVRDLLRVVKAELRGELPIIVFAGAPYTLATYCIGTGKNEVETRQFIREQPVVWERLMQKLTAATVHFLRVLVQDGADLYQLFDSWAGTLDRAEYQAWAQRQHRTIFEGARGVPRILFVKEGPYLDLMAQSGADVVSLGKCHDLAAARRAYPALVFQGNVDEKFLRSATAEQVEQATRQCVAAGGGRMHIVNLSHGCDKETRVANFEAFIRAAKG